MVEIASQKLGASLLDDRHGEGRTMYVRTSALVTNLGVHFKLGRENAMAWVTTLDKGQPVAGAAGYSLISCIVAPAFEFSGFELAPSNWAPGTGA